MPDCSLTAKGFRYSMAESAEEPKKLYKKQKKD
jgi:hypothetical protein